MLRQEPVLARLDERDRDALAPGPARPADAMDVRLGVRRDVVVHDVRDVIDVETAGGDVGRDEDVEGALAEAAHHAVALLWSIPPWSAAVSWPWAASRLRQVVDLAPGPGEHQGRGRVLEIEDAPERDGFVRPSDDVRDLADLGRRLARLPASIRTRTGSSRWRRAIFAIGGEIVAENSAVWRVFGVADRIASRSSAKPMSSISSASSRTTISIRSRAMLARVRWSTARPGVATRTSTPRARPRSCWPIAWPPYTGRTRIANGWP